MVALTIERTSANDVMELECDTTGTSMQVAAVLVLQPRSALDLGAVRGAFADRIVAVPRLRQRLVDAPFGCGRPVWVDDPAFAVADHVSAVGCPAPGDEHAMLGVVAETITRRLPADRPLWSVTHVTGLADGRSALVLVFHHVLTDGIGGLAVLAHLVDGDETVSDPGFPHSAPRRGKLWAEALRFRLRALSRIPDGVGRLRAAVAELGATGSARDGHAPRCSLNRPIGRRRALAVVRVDLAAVLTAAHAQGGTANDVVLTAVTGALRTVLAARGEDVDRLVVSIPVSARPRTGPTELGNQVGVLPVTLPVTGDPARRLAAVAAITRRRRTDAPGSSAALIGPVFRLLATAGVFGWFIGRQRVVNTFVSNLHGPPQRLRFLGAPVVDLIPVSMITGNVTVAFVVLSYAGTLNVTVVADPDCCSELDDLADAVRHELQVLSTPL